MKQGDVRRDLRPGCPHRCCVDVREKFKANLSRVRPVIIRATLPPIARVLVAELSFKRRDYLNLVLYWPILDTGQNRENGFSLPPGRAATKKPFR